MKTRFSIAVLVTLWVALFELLIISSLVLGVAPYEITRMHIVAEANSFGSLNVVQEIEVDYGDNPVRPLEIYQPARRQVGPDKTLEYFYPGAKVYGTDGAKIAISERAEGLNNVISLGGANKVKGKHRYRVEYSVRGLIQDAVGPSKFDTLDWDVVPARWGVPIRKMTVHIKAPKGSAEAECWRGGTPQVPCGQKPDQSASQVTMSVDGVQAKDTVSLKVRWPNDTLNAPSPYVTARALDSVPFHAELWMVFWVLWWMPPAYLLGRLIRRGYGDVRYVGVAPGVIPPDRLSRPVEIASKTPVAVRFAPPQFASAPDLAFVRNRKGDRTAIAAMILSLVGRGYLRVDKRHDGKHFLSWIGAHTAGLQDYEMHFISQTFALSPVVEFGSIPRDVLQSTFALLRVRAERGGIFRKRSAGQKWMFAGGSPCWRA